MNTGIEVAASLVECCIFVRLCNGFLGFKSETRKWLKTAALFIMLALVDVFLCQLDGFENISIIMLMFIMLAYAVAFLNGKLWEKLLVPIIPTITALPINLIVMSAFNAFSGNERAEVLPGGAMRIPVLFFSKAAFFLVCEIIIRARKKSTYFLNAYQWVIQLSCFLISFIISSLMWNFFRGQEETKPTFLIIFLLIALLNVLLYILMSKMQRDNMVKEEYKLLKSNISAQEKLAKETMERYSEVRTLKHDMKHYLTIAAELISNGESEEAKSYIESVLNEKIAPAGMVVNTGSAVVDAVINNKISLCSGKGIGIKCIIDTQFGSSNDIDISILLSNLLDNAINGCDNSNPHIELVISKVKSMTYIAVKNSIAESVQLNNPDLKTDKHNKSEHGFGVKSIKQIADKYDGCIEFKEENGVFIAEVWLNK